MDPKSCDPSPIGPYTMCFFLVQRPRCPHCLWFFLHLSGASRILSSLLFFNHDGRPFTITFTLTPLGLYLRYLRVSLTALSSLYLYITLSMNLLLLSYLKCDSIPTPALPIFFFFFFWYSWISFYLPPSECKIHVEKDLVGCVYSAFLVSCLWQMLNKNLLKEWKNEFNEWLNRCIFKNYTFGIPSNTSLPSSGSQRCFYVFSESCRAFILHLNS